MADKQDNTTPKAGSSQVDNRIAEIVEDFEHEFDVLTERLEITKPVFDGRLGDPAMNLKRFLTRFVKHRVTDLAKNSQEPK